MGRVKKYKKLKKFDLQNNKPREDKKRVEYNLPPNIKNHQANKKLNVHKKRRELPDWAINELKEESKRAKNERKDRKIERKKPNKSKVAENKISFRPNESLKSFNKRVDEMTKATLIEEAKKNSSTKSKRKKFLQEKDNKRKMIKNNTWTEFRTKQENDNIDLPIERDFQKAETIKFGETAEAPPNFKSLFKKGVSQPNESKAWIKNKSSALQSLYKKKEADEKNSEENTKRKKLIDASRLEALSAYKNLKINRRAGRVKFVAKNNR
mmetsp:Transcript_8813/g.12391  ORF Transcript_8813/g.12391 Transcript_8813/m.12391 type:complete len:267 (+) Transcript_8813:61-861(+)